MDKHGAPQRWFSGWRASAAPTADDDPADLGTAFGLDLSLNELHDLPAPTAPVERRAGWMRRLAAGRHKLA